MYAAVCPQNSSPNAGNKASCVRQTFPDPSFASGLPKVKLPQRCMYLQYCIM